MHDLILNYLRQWNLDAKDYRLEIQELSRIPFTVVYTIICTNAATGAVVKLPRIVVKNNKIIESSVIWLYHA
jgi:hypothetical protein